MSMILYLWPCKWLFLLILFILITGSHRSPNLRVAQQSSFLRTGELSQPTVQDGWMESLPSAAQML